MVELKPEQKKKLDKYLKQLKSFFKSDEFKESEEEREREEKSFSKISLKKKSYP